MSEEALSYLTGSVYHPPESARKPGWGIIFLKILTKSRQKSRAFLAKAPPLARLGLSPRQSRTKNVNLNK